MSESLSHDELQESLGAYALDALDGAERAAVDAHLATCGRCRAEVVGHRETAALLAFSGQDAPPPGVWDRIAASLEEAPPPLSISTERARPAPGLGDRGVREGRRSRRSGGARGPGRLSTRWLAGPPWATGLVAAAAAVLAVVALAVAVTGPGRVGDGDGSSPDQLAAADARRIELRSPDGDLAAQVVLASDGGDGIVVDDNLPALAEGEVYQLWGKRGTVLISLGLLGRDPDRQRFVAGDGGSFEAFAITAERWPGVVSSDQSPVVSGSTTSA